MQEKNFMSELEKIFGINSRIKEKIVYLKSEKNNENCQKIEKLEKFQQLINKEVSNKIDLLCSHIIEKTELLSEDFLRKNGRKGLEKKTEDAKDEKRRLDFLISFIKE